MNYTELVSAIKAYTENTFPVTPPSGGLSSEEQLAVFVQQAEQRVYNAVQLQVTRKEVVQAVSPGSNTVTTPTDWMSPYAVAVSTGVFPSDILDSDDNWTLTFGAAISNQTLILDSTVSGGATAVYTFEDGGFRAGNYAVTADIEGSVERVVVALLGAAGEARGGGLLEGNGEAVTVDITATGEVSKIEFVYPDSSEATLTNIGLVSSNSTRSYILNKESTFIYESFPSSSEIGTPEFYAMPDDNTILLGPWPDIAYFLFLDYYYYPESIVTATTTWLGDNFDSVLLYGALLEAATFMQNDEDVIAQIQKRYDEALALLKQYAEGKNRQDNFRTPPVRYPVR